MKNDGIGSWIERRRAKSGAKAALVFEGSTLSYSELGNRINRLAAALRSLGVTKGDRVAFLGENHPSFVETLFATASIGAIFVPLNTRLAGPEIEYLLTDSGSRILIHSAALWVVAGQAVRGLTIVGIEVDAAGGSSSTDYESMLASASPTYVDADVRLDDPVMIMYTSGTTGRPKGALLTHSNLTWNCINVLVDYDVVSADIAVMISPLFHAASLGMGALPAFMKGATVLLLPRFEAGAVLASIGQYRATWISGVPTTYQLMAEHPDWATSDISSLRILTCGGSPVPMRVLEAYEDRGLAFTGGYGLTETSPGATSLQPARSRDKAGSAGLPHFFESLRIVGSGGTDVGQDEVGEIYLSGPNVITEYWNRPDDSIAAFPQDGWFATGDLGHVDSEGFLFISDRLKDLIISGGENIYPAEIELLVAELDEVSGVAVIGVPDQRWGEVGRAVITLRDGHSLDEAAILSHLDGRIARYKIPRSFVFVDELPRTASGKIRKADLRRLYGDQASSNAMI
jgi:fatty-acyl-CoA synthase